MNTTTFDLPRRHALHRRDTLDWVFAALVMLGGAYAFSRYHASMDAYEKGILLCAMPASDSSSQRRKCSRAAAWNSRARNASSAS